MKRADLKCSTCDYELARIHGTHQRVSQWHCLSAERSDLCQDSARTQRLVPFYNLRTGSRNKSFISQLPRPWYSHHPHINLILCQKYPCYVCSYICRSSAPSRHSPFILPLLLMPSHQKMVLMINDGKDHWEVKRVRFDHKAYHLSPPHVLQSPQSLPSVPPHFAEPSRSKIALLSSGLVVYDSIH